VNETVGGLVGLNDGSVRTATASGNVTGSEFVGGLAGGNVGTIRNATVSGNVTGSKFVGGLAGANDDGGSVRTATATGSITGDSSVGGLIGANRGGNINNVTTSGNVAGSDVVGGVVGSNDRGRISDAFATGNVTADSNAGGVVGTNEDGTVTDSYWDEQTTGQLTSAGSGTGLMTAQMTGEAARTNMSGLDFEDTWTTTESYPELRALSQGNQTDPQPSPDGAVVSLQPQDLTLTPDETTTVSLVVNGTETIGAYNFNLTVEGASSVQIEEVSLNGGPGIEDVGIGADGREASADAALAEIESSADSAATLGTVMISGTDAGNATLSAEINTLGDTQGSPYTIADPGATASVTVANQTGPGDITGNGNPATDPDGDGVFEDVNGDGSTDVLDVQALFTNLGSESVAGNAAFDINGDGNVDVLDVQSLFTQL
jgi:hypothetical protein